MYSHKYEYVLLNINQSKSDRHPIYLRNPGKYFLQWFLQHPPFIFVTVYPVTKAQYDLIQHFLSLD